MKRLLLPKNKVAQVAINVAFIVIWEELAGLIVKIIWKTIGELEFFNQDSFLVLLVEILLLILHTSLFRTCLLYLMHVQPFFERFFHIQEESNDFLRYCIA